MYQLSSLGDVVVSARRPDAYVYSHDLVVDRKTEVLTGFAVRKWNPKSNIVEKIVEENQEEICTDWNTLTAEAVDKLNSHVNGLILSICYLL